MRILTPSTARMRTFQFPPASPNAHSYNRRRPPPPPLDLSLAAAREADARAAVVAVNVGPPTPRPVAFPSGPVSRHEGYRESPKRLAPLSRYNPFVRARSESMSSVIDNGFPVHRVHHVPRTPYPPLSPVDYGYGTPSPTTPSTPRGRAQTLRRMATVTDIFSRINRQAQMLGLRVQ